MNNDELVQVNLAWYIQCLNIESDKCLANWGEHCKPVNKGGLGLKPINYVNQAILPKQVWRVITAPKGSLLVDTLKIKHVNGSDDNLIHHQFLCHWTKLFVSWKLLLNSDPSSVNQLLIWRVSEKKEQKSCLLLSPFCGMSILLSWDKNKNDADKNKNDELDLLFVQNHWSRGRQYHFWKMNLPPKNLMLLWRPSHLAKPASEMLKLHHQDNDMLCAFGGDTDETIDHVFLYCNFEGLLVRV